MSTKTILLVEDNPDEAILTEKALRQCTVPTHVTIVRDGPEALEFLFCEGKYSGRNVEEQPDLILLDIKLPKITGLEVLDKIRHNQNTKLVPVVVLTSSDEAKDIAKSYALGANSYVRKPVDFQHFQEAVRHLASYWLGMNQMPA